MVLTPQFLSTIGRVATINLCSGSNLYFIEALDERLVRKMRFQDLFSPTFFQFQRLYNFCFVDLDFNCCFLFHRLWKMGG